MSLIARAWDEADWDHLAQWAESSDLEFSRPYVEANSPYRMVVENGTGPIAMFGWRDEGGIPFTHVLIKPEARSHKMWNAVYDLAIDTLRRCGYKRSVAMVPHGARIGSALTRKGWSLVSDLYMMEL